MKRVLIVDDNQTFAELHGSLSRDMLSNADTPVRMQALWDPGATPVLVEPNSSPKQVIEALKASAEVAR